MTAEGAPTTTVEPLTATELPKVNSPSVTRGQLLRLDPTPALAPEDIGRALSHVPCADDDGRAADRD